MVASKNAALKSTRYLPQPVRVSDCKERAQDQGHFECKMRRFHRGRLQTSTRHSTFHCQPACGLDFLEPAQKHFLFALDRVPTSALSTSALSEIAGHCKTIPSFRIQTRLLNVPLYNALLRIQTIHSNVPLHKALFLNQTRLLNVPLHNKLFLVQNRLLNVPLRNALFRVLEGASSGCLVSNPNMNLNEPLQDVLFPIRKRL